MYRPALTTTALALVALTAPAQAQSDKRFYVAGFIGGGFPGDAELTGTLQPAPGAPGTPGDPARINVEYDNDATYGIAIGYDLPLEFFDLFSSRLELEYSTIDADVSIGSLNGNALPFSGDTSIDFFLFNSYTDIIWSDEQTLIPFFGGGLGVANVDANVLYAGGGAAVPTFTVTGDSSGFASTFAGGVTYRSQSDWEVYAEARYYQIRDLDFERRFIGGGVDLFSADVSDDFDGTTLTAGLRYRF